MHKKQKKWFCSHGFMIGFDFKFQFLECESFY